MPRPRKLEEFKRFSVRIKEDTFRGLAHVSVDRNESPNDSLNRIIVARGGTLLKRPKGRRTSIGPVISGKEGMKRYPARLIPEAMAVLKVLHEDSGISKNSIIVSLVADEIKTVDKKSRGET